MTVEVTLTIDDLGGCKSILAETCELYWLGNVSRLLLDVSSGELYLPPNGISFIDTAREITPRHLNCDQTTRNCLWAN